MLKVENSGEPVLNQRIDKMSNDDLDFFLGRFVAEVRKEDGQEYPGKTIYEMICSLQCYLRFQRKGPLFLIDNKGCKFRNLNSALNFVLQRIKLNSMGFQTKRRFLFACDIGINALNAESMEERHDKVETKGEAAKILLLLLLRRKLKSVISDGNCKLRIFLVLKILFVVFLVVSSQ